MSPQKVRSPIARRRALARLGVLALLALVLAATTGCKKRHKALELYREGYHAFRFGADLKRAEGILQKALETDPTLTQAHMELAVIYMYDDGPDSTTFSLDDAEHHLRETIRLAPDHIYAHYLLGRVAYTRGGFDEALREFDTTIRLLEWPFGSELGGNWKQLYLFKGYILLDAGDFAKAEATFDKYNSFYPDKYFYLAGMVLAAEARGDRSRAEALSGKMFEKYVLEEPAAYLGLLEMFRGRPELAAGIFERRLKNLDGPKGPPDGELDKSALYMRESYRLLLAWAYTKAGRADDAKAIHLAGKRGIPPSTLEILRLAIYGSLFGSD